MYEYGVEKEDMKNERERNECHRQREITVKGLKRYN